MNNVVELGLFLHPCEGDMVCVKADSQAKVPYFNAPIYTKNNAVIGRVDEILGPMTRYMFTVKLQEGIIATSFKPNDKVYVGTDKLLPMDRFVPKPKIPGGKVQKPLGHQGYSCCNADVVAPEAEVPPVAEVPHEEEEDSAEVAPVALHLAEAAPVALHLAEVVEVLHAAEALFINKRRLHCNRPLLASELRIGRL